MNKALEKNLINKIRKIEQRRKEKVKWSMERLYVLSTIDELNQYLNGNVTKSSLIQNLEELKNKLDEE